MATPTVPKPRATSTGTTNQNDDIRRLGWFLAGAWLMAVIMLITWYSTSRIHGVAFGLLIFCLGGMLQAYIQDLRHHRKD